MQSLIAELADDDVGGLLAIPVSETLKQVVGRQVVATVPRENYRLAGTPQMFRYGLLVDALARAQENDILITDEAHAMELAGHKVKLVQGGADNIKITHPEDLVLAEFILNRQGAL
jgi:2-C-methyl-D-erythritol 4-phosphate cytidylyltransferase